MLRLKGLDYAIVDADLISLINSYDYFMYEVLATEISFNGLDSSKHTHQSQVVSKIIYDYVKHTWNFNWDDNASDPSAASGTE